MSHKMLRPFIVKVSVLGVHLPLRRTMYVESKSVVDLYDINYILLW